MWCLVLLEIVMMLIRQIMTIGKNAIWLPFCCNFCGNWRRWWMNADWPVGLVCLVISDTIASWPHVKPKYIMMMMTRSSWSLWYWPCNSFTKENKNTFSFFISTYTLGKMSKFVQKLDFTKEYFEFSHQKICSSKKLNLWNNWIILFDPKWSDEKNTFFVPVCYTIIKHFKLDKYVKWVQL